MKGRFGLVGKVLKDTAAQAKASVGEAAEEAAKRKALRDGKNAANKAWMALMWQGFPEPGEDMSRIHTFLAKVKEAKALEEQEMIVEAAEAYATASPFTAAELEAAMQSSDLQEEMWDEEGQVTEEADTE